MQYLMPDGLLQLSQAECDAIVSETLALGPIVSALVYSASYRIPEKVTADRLRGAFVMALAKDRSKGGEMVRRVAELASWDDSNVLNVGCGGF